MVSRFLGVLKPLPRDASDALAVAICHLNHARAGAVATSANRGHSRSNRFASLAHRISPAFRGAQERAE